MQTAITDLDAKNSFQLSRAYSLQALTFATLMKYWYALSDHVSLGSREPQIAR
jgi:hypothetical protein